MLAISRSTIEKLDTYSNSWIKSSKQYVTNNNSTLRIRSSLTRNAIYIYKNTRLIVFFNSSHFSCTSTYDAHSYAVIASTLRERTGERNRYRVYLFFVYCLCNVVLFVARDFTTTTACATWSTPDNKQLQQTFQRRFNERATVSVAAMPRDSTVVCEKFSEPWTPALPLGRWLPVPWLLLVPVFAYCIVVGALVYCSIFLYDVLPAVKESADSVVFLYLSWWSVAQLAPK